MAEDDEAHRKVAVKVAGAVGACLLALAVPFTGWGIAGRGSWQATAAFGFAAGLLVAAVAQGVIWLLMHVRRPLLETPPHPESPPHPASPRTEEIATKMVKLLEYRDGLSWLSNLERNGDAWVQNGTTRGELDKLKAEATTYLDLKLHPIAKVVAETGVYANFQDLERKRRLPILTQALGVLADARESLLEAPPRILTQAQADARERLLELSPRTDGPAQLGVAQNAPAVLKVLPMHLGLIADESPIEAVREAWQLVVTDLGVLFDRERLTNVPFADSLNELSRRNVISADAVESITGLSQLLQLNDGRASEVTPARARDFLRMADAIAWVLRVAARNAKTGKR